MTPFSTPLPSSTVTPAINEVSNCGGLCPCALRPLTVTFPTPSAYSTNICEPDICRPVPTPTHRYEVGAVIERYILPLVDSEIAEPEGIPILYLGPEDDNGA